MATQQELIEAENNLRNLGLLNNQGSLQPNLGLQSNLGLLSAQNPMQASLQNSLTAPGGVFSGNTPGGAFSQTSNNVVNPPPKKRGVGGFFRDAIGLALNPNFVENRQMRELIDSQNVPQQTKDLLNLLSRNEQIKYLTGEGKGKDRRIVVQDGIQYYVDTGERVLPNVEKSLNLTEKEKDRKKLIKLESIPVELRSQEDNKNLALLELSIYGVPRVIPFYDSQGQVVKSITNIDLAKNPDILTKLEDQGLFTVGQSPSVSVKGKKSVFNIMGDDYLNVKNQLNTYNDLAEIIDTNRDAFTIAGSIGNFVNSGRYELKSAQRLMKLNNFKDNDSEGYSELIKSLDKYSSQLNKLSQNRAVAKSIFLKLAYGVAKEIDPSGRLSDNDVKIAMDIIGNLGPNVDANLAVLENLAKGTTRSYTDKYNLKYKQLEDVKEIESARQYIDLPKFLGGRKTTRNSGNRTLEDIMNDPKY